MGDNDYKWVTFGVRVAFAVGVTGLVFGNVGLWFASSVVVMMPTVVAHTLGYLRRVDASEQPRDAKSRARGRLRLRLIVVVAVAMAGFLIARLQS